MVGLALPLVRVFPNPDGDITAPGDRAQYLYLYRGTLGDGTAAGTENYFFRWRRGL